jgi:hypothetical protein
MNKGSSRVEIRGLCHVSHLESQLLKRWKSEALRFVASLGKISKTLIFNKTNQVWWFILVIPCARVVYV